jgi:hypothetical protein
MVRGYDEVHRDLVSIYCVETLWHLAACTRDDGTRSEMTMLEAIKKID